MKPNIIIGIGVIAALILGVYLWSIGLPGTSLPTTSDTTVHEEKPLESTTGVTATTLEEQMVGKWRSMDNTMLVREFTASGVVTDRYQTDDDRNTTGSWDIVTNGEGLPGAIENADGKIILRIEFPEEALFYSITKLTNRELELAYVGLEDKPFRYQKIP